jgi:ribosomal protein S18 acetylase RimI-like enzyme
MAAPPSDAALRAMADRQSAAFFLATRDRPWAAIHDEPDVIHGTTGIPLPIFNGATNARFTAATADERIDAVLRPFREARIDMTWAVGPTSTPLDLADRLIAHGLTVDEAAPIMACSLVDRRFGPPPAGIETEIVVDAAGFHVATEIMFAGFGIPEALMPVVEERYAGFAIGPRAIQRVYLARLEGRPVATALGFTLDGVVGIYNVATLPAARRRGAGRAATEAAMAEAAAHGATAALLESSAMGRSVYERLGFREVGTVTILLGAFGSIRTADPPDG